MHSCGQEIQAFETAQREIDQLILSRHELKAATPERRPPRRAGELLPKIIVLVFSLLYAFIFLIPTPARGIRRRVPPTPLQLTDRYNLLPECMLTMGHLLEH